MIKSTVFLLFISVLFALNSNGQNTFPVNDVANPREGCYLFIHATIVKDSRTTLQDGSMIVRLGKIENIGTALPTPKDAVIVDCKGKYIYPSFIDIFSDYGMQAGKSDPGGSRVLSNSKGAYGWNQAIRSETNGSELFRVNAAKAKELRAIGIGTVLTHQMDGISRGTGTVVTLGLEKENKVMLKEKASANFSFDKGSSTQDYPTSLMGAIALLRQNYLDAQWYQSKPAEEGINLSLKAFNDNLSLPQIFESNDKWSDLRAAKIGTEFGVQYIIKGAGNEYQRIDEIKGINTSFILPLNFPLAMDVDDTADARFVSLADLKHWEMAPLNPASFEKANISFALTANGLKDLNSFSANLRKAIRAGLSEAKALDALTKIPAMLLKIDDQVGSLESGKIANFLITSGPVFEDKTVIFQNWIQGNKYLVKEDGWKDRRGHYSLVFNSDTYRLELKGDAAKPFSLLIGKDTLKSELQMNDRLIKLTITSKKDTTFKVMLSGVMSDENWSGSGQTANGKWISWIATRTGETTLNADTTKLKKGDFKIESEVTFPFNGYGFKQLPGQETILIKNTTVWTSEKAGKLDNTDVLVRNGKIAEIGTNLRETTARIIDGTGKHLSAGIIDEHSHIAASGDINECSQSVTAETRIGDVINPEDIDIYRQLSGGVTSTHILHGSCNTIGGQTQLIKLRWGSDPSQLKFDNWDPFIKFALGENVKRSYYSSNPRFPDTRMGVEEVLTDAFTRAAEYQKSGKGKRKDLELEALSEILNKKRFITCHSYVQSEINSLIKVADKFNFTVNTFTHILEGYKVADKMKAHGANASTFSDWWIYKMEVVDAIPQNAYLMQKEGINVAINSDDPEMARRLNQEAAKSVKYANMDEEDALKMVTINPATMLHVGDRTGSIKVGKDADLVLWSDHPLSIYAKAEITLVDGIVYFDRVKDLQLREEILKERTRLIQKMINAKKGGEKTVPATPSFGVRNYCQEGCHDGNSLQDRLEHRQTSTELQQ